MSRIHLKKHQDHFAENPFANFPTNGAPHTKRAGQVSSSPTATTFRDGRRPPRSGGTISGVYVFVLVAIVVCTIGGLALGWWSARSGSNKPQRTLVYLELKVQDPSGNAAENVVISDGRNTLGTTDSLGNWQRVMRQPVGKTVGLKLTKNDANARLIGHYNFKVPNRPPRNAQTEYKETIRLHFDRRATPKSVARTQLSSQPRSNLDPQLANTLATSAADSVNTAISRKIAAHGSRESETAPVEAGAAIQFVFHSAENGSSPPLPWTRLSAELTAQAESLGLSVVNLASWKAVIMKVTVDGEKGAFLRVESRFGTNEPAIRFLISEDQPQTTAKRILDLLKHHVNKRYVASIRNGTWVLHHPFPKNHYWYLDDGDTLINAAGHPFFVSRYQGTNGQDEVALAPSEVPPCPQSAQADSCFLHRRNLVGTPPFPDWTTAKVQVPSNIPADAEIYVAGLAAVPLGGGYWRFWAKDGAAANITILTGDQVLMRSKILASHTKVTQVALERSRLVKK
jgi:hypothetical protein